MKIMNESCLNTAKVAVVKTYIKSASDLLTLGKKMKEYEINSKEVVWISLFEEKVEKVSVSDLRAKMIELEEVLRVSGVRVVVDLTSKRDAKEGYVSGLIFKDIFGRDNSLWKDRGVLSTTLGDWSGKFICGIRWDTVKREMQSSDMIDNEFKLKDESINIVIPRTEEEIKSAFNTLAKSKVVVLDTEASGLKPFAKDFLLYTLQFTGDNDKNTSYVFMYEHPKVFVEDKLKKLIQKGSEHLLYNKKIWVHNFSYDGMVLKAKFDIDFYKVDIYDSMIIYHFLTNTYVQVPLGLKNICFTQGIFYDWESQLDIYKKEYCQANKMKVDDFKYEYFELNDLIKYAGIDTIALMYLVDRLYEMCVEHIAYKNERLHVINETWEKHWQPIMQSLYQVMSNGLPFNMEKAKKLREENLARVIEIDELILNNPFVKNAEKIINERNFAKAMEAYNKKVQEAENKGKTFKGAEPNWEKGKYGSINFDVKFSTTSNAHKEVLFIDVLKMKILEKTDSGSPKLSDDIITQYAELRPDISILGLFSEKAKLGKLLGTYIEPWVELVEEDRDGRLRSTFNPLNTSGRLRGNSPNLLNVPKKGGLKELIEADYKNGMCVGQIDVNSLEAISAILLHQDEYQLKLIEELGELDPHSGFSILRSKIAEDGVLEHLDSKNIEHIKLVKRDYPDHRSKSKSGVFSIQFLGSHKSIMYTYNLPEDKALKLWQGHWDLNKGEWDFIQSCITRYAENGYTIVHGRIPVLSPNMTTNMEDKENMNRIRTVYNAEHQSSAFAVLRALDWSMRYFRDKGVLFKPLISVYDSIIYECGIDNINEISNKLYENMSIPFIENQLFPLQHEVEVGKSYKAEFVLSRDKDEQERQILEFKENLIKN